jgi:uncharacterized protein YkwD
MFTTIVQVGFLALILVTVGQVIIEISLLSFTPQRHSVPFTLTEFEQQTIAQINQYRLANDKAPFKINNYLSQMAEQHTINMVINQIMTSEGIVEIKQQIIRQTKCDEVQYLLSRAYQSSQGILKVWKADDQYDNILKADFFKQIGIAILNDSKMRPYCTVILTN